MNTNLYEYNGVESVPNDVVHVIVKEGVTFIPNSAFDKCRNLESIRIADSVTKIGNGAFIECRSLVTISLVPSIKEIHDFAFSRCNNLSNIDNIWNYP